MKRYILKLLLILFLLCTAAPAYASIMIRIMGINPDENLQQTVKLKAYLPLEVEPEDVLDKGDMEVIYDTQKGAYYVYGEYQLDPKESIRREVEIKDIWLISTPELEGLRDDTIQTADLLESTQFKDRAGFLRNGIETKLNDIIKRQKVSAANPQKHISEYRENMKFLESAKTDLILIRSLLAQAKPLPSIAIWKVFLGITGFLGLIGFSLFFFVNKRVRMMSAPAPEGEIAVDSEDAEMLISTEPEAEKSEGEEKKSLSPEDIEKMMEE